MLNAYIKYYEKDFRDGKLGFPLGIRNFDNQLPLTAEAYYSNISHSLMKESVADLKTAFYGKGDDLGINNLLTSGGSNILNKIETQWTNIQLETNNINTPIEEYVLTNQGNGKDTYSEIQELLVLLKIDLMSCLDMKISYVDTDGD